VESWTSLVVLAALSAEPESFAELAAAVRRYHPEHRLFDRPWYSLGRYAAGTLRDGAWCVIDLIGRTVVAEDRAAEGGRGQLADQRLDTACALHRPPAGARCGRRALCVTAGVRDLSHALFRSFPPLPSFPLSLF